MGLEKQRMQSQNLVRAFSYLSDFCFCPIQTAFYLFLILNRNYSKYTSSCNYYFVVTKGLARNDAVILMRQPWGIAANTCSLFPKKILKFNVYSVHGG